MRAVDNRRAEMVELLLTAGAGVNAADRRGKTALMAAALGGNRRIVELLLSAGADLYQTGANGWSAPVGAAGVSEVEVRQLDDPPASPRGL